MFNTTLCWIGCGETGTVEHGWWGCKLVFPLGRGMWPIHQKLQIRGEFPGGPVVRTPCFHCRGARVQTLVRELRFHKPHGTAKKKKKNYKYMIPLLRMYSVASGMHRRGHMQEIVHCNHVCDKKQWKQQVALSGSDASLGWTTSLLKQRAGCALSTGVESALLYPLRKISKGQDSAYNLLPFV